VIDDAILDLHLPDRVIALEVRVFFERLPETELYGLNRTGSPGVALFVTGPARFDVLRRAENEIAVSDRSGRTLNR